MRIACHGDSLTAWDFPTTGHPTSGGGATTHVRSQVVVWTLVAVVAPTIPRPSRWTSPAWRSTNAGAGRARMAWIDNLFKIMAETGLGHPCHVRAPADDPRRGRHRAAAGGAEAEQGPAAADPLRDLPGTEPQAVGGVLGHRLRLRLWKGSAASAATTSATALASARCSAASPDKILLGRASPACRRA